MIRFLWMFLTAIGFMVAGALLAYGEFKVGLCFMVGAWLWLAFPKVTLWALEGTANVIGRRGKTKSSSGAVREAQSATEGL